MSLLLFFNDSHMAAIQWTEEECKQCVYRDIRALNKDETSMEQEKNDGRNREITM